MSLISKWQLGIWIEMRDVAPGPYQHRLITWLCKWISENVSFSYLFRQKAWISSLKVSAELTSTYRLNRCCFFFCRHRDQGWGDIWVCVVERRHVMELRGWLWCVCVVHPLMLRWWCSPWRYESITALWRSPRSWRISLFSLWPICYH